MEWLNLTPKRFSKRFLNCQGLMCILIGVLLLPLWGLNVGAGIVKCVLKIQNTEPTSQGKQHHPNQRMQLLRCYGTDKMGYCKRVAGERGLRDE